jgi:hypothetical protein
VHTARLLDEWLRSWKYQSESRCANDFSSSSRHLRDLRALPRSRLCCVRCGVHVAVGCGLTDSIAVTNHPLSVSAYLGPRGIESSDVYMQSTSFRALFVRVCAAGAVLQRLPQVRSRRRTLCTCTSSRVHMHALGACPHCETF